MLHPAITSHDALAIPSDDTMTISGDGALAIPRYDVRAIAEDADARVVSDADAPIVPDDDSPVTLDDATAGSGWQLVKAVGDCDRPVFFCSRSVCSQGSRWRARKPSTTEPRLCGCG